MTLTLGTHYLYDEFGRYYYLTPVGAEKITGIDTLDNDWKRVEWRLKSQGKLLKEIMVYTTNDDLRPRYSRKDFIEYKQFKNLNNERNDICFMLGEIAEWAWNTDGDRIVYEEGGPLEVVKKLPFTIRTRGANTGLVYFGETIYEVPEDEYQVGY